MKKFSVAGGKTVAMLRDEQIEQVRLRLGRIPRPGECGVVEQGSNSVPQPKTDSLKAVGCRPLKISSLRNGKAANLLK